LGVMGTPISVSGGESAGCTEAKRRLTRTNGVTTAILGVGPDYRDPLVGLGLIWPARE
jgi:hypothetical protein